MVTDHVSFFGQAPGWPPGWESSLLACSMLSCFALLANWLKYDPQTAHAADNENRKMGGGKSESVCSLFLFLSDILILIRRWGLGLVGTLADFCITACVEMRDCTWKHFTELTELFCQIHQNPPIVLKLFISNREDNILAGYTDGKVEGVGLWTIPREACISYEP